MSSSGHLRAADPARPAARPGPTGTGVPDPGVAGAAPASLDVNLWAVPADGGGPPAGSSRPGHRPRWPPPGRRRDGRGTPVPGIQDKCQPSLPGTVIEGAGETA